MFRLTDRSSFALVLAVLMWCASVLVAQQTTTATATAPRRGGNPEAAALKNPVASTPQSLAAGKRFYTQFCANCHGPVGKGDGTTAGADQASDLTDGVWDYGASDGEIFAVIHDGLTGKDMGGYAGRISDNDIWSVVNFIRTLSRVQGQK
jgi:mono/diheme cytochrome c family protein